MQKFCVKPVGCSMIEKDRNHDELTADRGELFMKLYTDAQRRLYAYVISLVPDESSVEDIIQETATYMWRHFNEFEIGTNFPAWAFSIAKNRILAHIKNQQKTRRHFSTQTLQEIEKTVAARQESLDDRLWALRKCIEKLSTNDRQLLILRYEIGASLKSVSERLRQSVNTLYNRLYRIRILLMHCIEKTIGKENLPG